MNKTDIISNNDYPSFNKYVARCAQWKWHDGSRIDILDKKGNIVLTLNELQTWIFYEADGGRTVKNLLEWSAEHYRDGLQIPPDLDETNLMTLSSLVDDLQVITLCQEAPVLPDHFLIPRGNPNK
jgi:hypothetical protein